MNQQKFAQDILLAILAADRAIRQSKSLGGLGQTAISTRWTSIRTLLRRPRTMRKRLGLVTGLRGWYTEPSVCCAGAPCTQASCRNLWRKATANKARMAREGLKTDSLALAYTMMLSSYDEECSNLS